MLRLKINDRVGRCSSTKQKQYQGCVNVPRAFCLLLNTSAMPTCVLYAVCTAAEAVPDTVSHSYKPDIALYDDI